MKKYILYSTLLSIFSESLYINVGFDFKIIYIVIFINYFLIKEINGKIVFPKHLLYILIYLLFTGIITIFLYNNQLSKVAFQVFGIAYMSIYFYNFFLCSDLNEIQIFEKYCNISFYISIIGFPLFFIIVNINSNYRLHSVLEEPAHFCGIVLPAFYYFLTNFKKYKVKFFTILAALLLSISSIGYIGMLVGIIMMKKKVNLAITGGLIFSAILLGFLAYTFIYDVRFRVDDTLNVAKEQDVSDVNSSTMALATNAFVASQAFESNFLIGRGVGSHPISFKKYIYQLTGVEGYEAEEDLFFLNSTDAASLTLRMLSELGLIGIVGVLYFIIKNYSSYGDNYKISRAIFLYFLYKLIREGHYFSPEMYFFVFIYYLLNLHSKNTNINDVILT